MKDKISPGSAEYYFTSMDGPFVSCPNDNSCFWLESLRLANRRDLDEGMMDEGEMTDSERCPFCDRMVQAEAEKCSHCGKPLNVSLYQRVG